MLENQPIDGERLFPCNCDQQKFWHDGCMRVSVTRGFTRCPSCFAKSKLPVIPHTWSLFERCDCLGCIGTCQNPGGRKLDKASIMMGFAIFSFILSFGIQIAYDVIAPAYILMVVNMIVLIRNFSI